MSDAELIDKLGGPAMVARQLGYPLPRGTARVHNWKTRGIPPGVKLLRPDLFLPQLQEQGAGAGTGTPDVRQ